MQPGLTNEQISDITYRMHDIRATQSIQINPLFISYSHADTTFVDKLGAMLTEKGVRYWRDIHHATAGKLEKVVDRAMKLNPPCSLCYPRMPLIAIGCSMKYARPAS